MFAIKFSIVLLACLLLSHVLGGLLTAPEAQGLGFLLVLLAVYPLTGLRSQVSFRRYAEIASWFSLMALLLGLTQAPFS